MNPTEELRQAATTLRKLANGAISGPWRPSDDNLKCVMGPLGESVAAVHWENEGTPRWIATMSPAVAEPLAALLEVVADHEDGPALALARVINAAS